MGKITVTFDTGLHKVAPIDPDAQMIEATFAGKMETQDLPGQIRRRAVMADNYGAMIAAIPDILPGVVVLGMVAGKLEELKARIAELETEVNRLHAGWAKANADVYAAQMDSRSLKERISNMGSEELRIHGEKCEWMNRAIAAEAQIAAQAGQEPILYTAVPIRKIPSDWPQLDPTNAAFAAIGWNECRDAVLKAHKSETPAQPIATSIVQAALEAAAKVCAKRKLFEVADAIRAIDKQAIIDAATKGQS